MARPKSTHTKLPVRPKVPFTPERKLIFLEAMKNTGMLYLSAEAAGVAVRTVEDHRAEDEEFRDAYWFAYNHYTENVVVQALKDRAIKGYTRPIIGGKDRDMVVAEEQVFSDPCLLALVKSRDRRFNKGAEDGDQGKETGLPGQGGGASLGGSGLFAGILMVPYPPPTKEEWEAQYGEAAKGLTHSPPGGA